MTAIEPRDAALAYASRGIPVVPLHYPVASVTAARPVPVGQPPAPPTWSLACSCGDRACGQVGKHPLGQLVPHGLKEATTNRARVLAWWSQHPQANVGLATGHRFDVLDLDGPAGVQALRRFAEQHGSRLPATGPVVRSGREQEGWHYYLAPAGLPRRTGVLEGVDYQALGGYVVAPPSRHATGNRYAWARDLTHPLPALPGALYARLAERAHPARSTPAVLPVRQDGPGDPWARSALVPELRHVANARPPAPGRPGERNQVLWEAARNLYNLVASGALDEREVERGLLDAAGRCGLLADEPRQTHRTLASARQVGLANPRRPPDRPAPEGRSAPPPAAREAGARTPTAERR
jgi:Bifunctional DNA primase/polymerase, N-terminal